MCEDILYVCPKCNDVLNRKPVHKVEVDTCDQCGGIWLDRGELVKLKLSAGRRTMAHAQQSNEVGRNVPPTSQVVSLPCPACNGVLTPLQVGEIAVDICSKCRGLWLDRGELEVTMKALEDDDNPALIDALIGLSP